MKYQHVKQTRGVRNANANANANAIRTLLQHVARVSRWKEGDQLRGETRELGLPRGLGGRLRGDEKERPRVTGVEGQVLQHGNHQHHPLLSALLDQQRVQRRGGAIARAHHPIHRFGLRRRQRNSQLQRRGRRHRTARISETFPGNLQHVGHKAVRSAHNTNHSTARHVPHHHVTSYQSQHSTSHDMTS